MPNKDRNHTSQNQPFPEAPQEPTENRRSSTRGNRSKQHKKHETSYEESQKDGKVGEDVPSTTMQPSILSQLGAPNFTSQFDLQSNLDPSLESYGESPPNPNLEAPRASAADWTTRTTYGTSPPLAHPFRSASGSSRPKGGFSQASPPASPNIAYRIPGQQSHGYQNFGGYAGASPPRPEFLYGNTGMIPNPPPPHLAQAHFYATPDIPTSAFENSANKPISPPKSCSTFDRLPSTVNSTRKGSRDVLLVGLHAELCIYDLKRKNLELIGGRSNLRGRVIGAKILPACTVSDPNRTRDTLITIVLHGRCLPAPSRWEHGRGDKVAQDEFDASASMTDALQQAGSEAYQTTVEVYNLKDGSYVTTLLASPRIEASGFSRRGVTFEPAPFGGLDIQASGRFIVISSSVSGEVFLYEQSLDISGSLDVRFNCIGKTWTSIASKQLRSSSMSSAGSAHSLQEEDNPSDDHTMLSLQTRWLALTPPLASSRTTIHAQVHPFPERKIPGFTTHTAPEQPSVTCEVDSPRAESLMNRIARDATQEFVKGARWVGTQGFQMWNRYWAKPSSSIEEAQTGSGMPSAAGASPPFPPTHAQDSNTQKPKGKPALVSILDLENLSQSQQLKDNAALQPFATFALPNGCSALSFAPSGIQLFTASGRGDMQQVWDLMRLIHGETGLMSTPPVIREVAFFPRMTEARIVDVVWSEPSGERLALLTDTGTVHIYDMPSSAFYWPPLRRSRRTAAASTPTKEDGGKSGGERSPEGSEGVLSSTLGGISGRAQPFLSNIRGRTPSIGSSFSGLGGFSLTAEAGAKGGKAMAAGLNRSLTAAASGTVNTLRHLGENRIHLPRSAIGQRQGAMSWLHGNEDALLAVTTSDIVRIHAIRRSRSTDRRRRSSAVDNRPVEIVIPASGQDPDLDNSHDRPPPTPMEPSKNGWLTTPLRPIPQSQKQERHPLSFAEIETHAPYQPFHTDRRVTFHLYNGRETSYKAGSILEEGPMVFGGEIPSTKLAALAHLDDDDSNAANDDRHSIVENVIRKESNEAEGQQILITTRRRRQKKTQADTEEAGEFFEDDLEVVDFAHDRV